MEAVTEVTPDPEKNYEIVNGQPEEKEMPGAIHGGVCGRLVLRSGSFVEANKLGGMYVETGFQIGRNERIPDLAFISADRLPAEEPEGKWLIVPDLAVEIISPNDLYVKVTAKVGEYLNAGVKQVWLVAPEDRTITIYRSITDIIAFPGDGELVCEDLFPGFRCPLGDILRIRQSS
ncbi:MAG TPA: Uma2 family endonuclease [Blastocatellia bacterium]|nr:Uma2 family endonuclease [Blastocatellia bacterium]